MTLANDNSDMHVTADNCTYLRFSKNSVENTYTNTITNIQSIPLCSTIHQHKISHMMNLYIQILNTYKRTILVTKRPYRALSHTETRILYVPPCVPHSIPGCSSAPSSTARYCLKRQSAFISLTEKTLIYFHFSLEAAGCHTPVSEECKLRFDVSLWVCWGKEKV